MSSLLSVQLLEDDTFKHICNRLERVRDRTFYQLTNLNSDRHHSFTTSEIQTLNLLFDQGKAMLD